MTWVKVCGLRTAPAVAAAVEAGADAVGFVTFPPSPRFVTLDEVTALAADVPTLTVLLTVSQTVEAVMGAVLQTGVTGVQPYGLHADDVTTAALDAGLTVLRPVSGRTGVTLADDGSIPLIDTPDDRLVGGTGRSFDWSVLDALDDDFVLAGGLGPHNVAAAIARVDPWGVDASSGLELAPGVKDTGKVTAFIQEAKRS